LEEFVDSIDWSIKEIGKLSLPFALRPRISAAEIFPKAELIDIRSQVFGCDPDYNAWMGGVRNPRPHCENKELRSCGGHIHVGIQLPKSHSLMENRKQTVLRLIKAKDLFLGVPSVMMDEDTVRRKLYGKAGSFRVARHSPIAYEYRTLSNFWIRNKTLSAWAYEQTIRAIKFVKDMGDKFEEFMLKDDLENQIQRCINEGNVNLSHKLIVRHDLSVV